MMENKKMECQTVTRNWVSLLTGDGLECRLCATIINGQTLYVVGDNGYISEEFTDYEQALQAYIGVQPTF